MKVFAKRRWIVVPFVLLALVVAGVLFPAFNSVNLRSPATIELGRLGLLWLALRSYADDHAGAFPATLADLTPGYLPPEEQKFHDLTTRRPVNWTYYPGHTMHDPPDTILAAFPVRFSPGPVFGDTKPCALSRP